MTPANPNQNHRRGGTRRLWALICLVLFVGLQFAAVSEQLHEAIHADAHHTDHTCVIKLLSQGQLEAAAQEFTIPQPLLVLNVEPIQKTYTISPVEFLLPPGRAPPVV